MRVQSMRLRGEARALIAIALCSVGQMRAYAQSAEAEAAFGEGDRLMAAGKIAEACDAFEASNRVEQRAGTLIRLGECREKNRQLASAWSAYKDALTRVRDPRKRENGARSGGGDVPGVATVVRNCHAGVSRGGDGAARRQRERGNRQTAQR